MKGCGGIADCQWPGEVCPCRGNAESKSGGGDQSQTRYAAVSNRIECGCTLELAVVVLRMSGVIRQITRWACLTTLLSRAFETPALLASWELLTQNVSCTAAKMRDVLSYGMVGPDSNDRLLRFEPQLCCCHMHLLQWLLNEPEGDLLMSFCRMCRCCVHQMRLMIRLIPSFRPRASHWDHASCLRGTKSV